MGCSSSKEAPPAPPPRPVAPAPAAAKPEPPKETKPGPTTAAVPMVEGNERMTVPLKGENGEGVTVVDLNDITSASPSSLAGPRDRFLSYASGASTPNTSAGNLSWDGNSQSSQSDSSEKKAKKNAGGRKSLKHSGSAIGLDDIHSDAAGLTSKVVHIEVPFGKPIEEVYDGVHNGPVLGSGVSGLVRLVSHKATGVQYAVKCLDLGLVGTKEGLAQLREEIFIMCQLDHPNIVRLEEVYESHSEIYLVQELCVGGELFDRLDEQPDYHYTEAECARLVKQMLSAVRYLHSKGIIHRDLKLENFLFSSKAADSELKMIDFGLSKHFRFGEVHHEAVGTPYTVAPEVIHGSYDERCDIWAIGVITFLLLSGDPPFGGCGGPEPLLTVRANILSGQFAFEPEDIWCLVSEKAKEFVKAMLVVDPKNRPTAREAQKHVWLREWASRSTTHLDKALNPNVVKALVNFKEFSDMRKLLSEVLSFTLLPDQIKELRKEFEKMDTDGSGEISLSALKQVLMTNAGAGSLGALTEEEVEDIFNAMRVNKSETRIHWHEFIAAGLSQCQVDDRNLRLAFDRLDSDHKGYITLDDIMNLAGSDELHSQLQIRNMWRESMMAVRCTQSHITYENFLLLMKGQTRDPEPAPPLLPTPLARHKMLAVPEGVQVDLEEEPDLCLASDMRDEKPLTDSPARSADGMHFLERGIGEGSPMNNSLPNLGVNPMYDSASQEFSLSSHESPSGRKLISDINGKDATNMPDIEHPVLRRGRSKSLANENECIPPVDEISLSRRDSRRAIALPEHDSETSEELAKNKSALAVNRHLYRAHRQMRISVMEASRRLEEFQTLRARDTLIAQKEKEAGMHGVPQAGLVMRHGHRAQVTSEAIRAYLEESRAEQQQMVEKANRRGGRGRASRKKTISDMSAMMNPSMGQDELGDISVQAASKTPDVSKKITTQLNGNMAKLEMPTLPKTREENPNLRHSMPVEGLVPSVEVIDTTLRTATVPGDFRKTEDPFSVDGMYGGARITALPVSRISTTAEDTLGRSGRNSDASKK